MRKLMLIGLIAAALVPTPLAAKSHGHNKQHRSDVRHVVHRDVRHLVRRDVRQARPHRQSYTRYAPPSRNWSYRRLRAGNQLGSRYYAQRYYINNYGAYQLRAPSRYTRWIRYGDDLLLVNIRTGRVIDVVRGRYW